MLAGVPVVAQVYVIIHGNSYGGVARGILKITDKFQPMSPVTTQHLWFPQFFLSRLASYS